MFVSWVKVKLEIFISFKPDRGTTVSSFDPIHILPLLHRTTGAILDGECEWLRKYVMDQVHYYMVMFLNSTFAKYGFEPAMSVKVVVIFPPRSLTYLMNSTSPL